MKVLQSRFVFKKNLTHDGKIGQYKARLVVKGFMQENVPETYEPVVDFSSVRVVLTITIQKGFRIHQIDVRTAFLHRDIKNTVYISLPSGVAQINEFICKSSEVLCLRKGLQGVKEAPLLWNQKWKQAMRTLGFVALQSDQCLFRRNDTMALTLCR